MRRKNLLPTVLIALAVVVGFEKYKTAQPKGKAPGFGL